MAAGYVTGTVVAVARRMWPNARHHFPAGDRDLARLEMIAASNPDKASWATEDMRGLTRAGSVDDGEYCHRIAHQLALDAVEIGLHVAGAPQWYISCAQIAVTGGGSASPSKVSIPGYVAADGESRILRLDIHNGNREIDF